MRPKNVTAATTAGEVVTFGGYCHLTWAVAGNVASLAGAQACPELTTWTGAMWTPSFTTGTITVQGTAATISWGGTGILASALLPTGSEACTFTESGTYVSTN
jgi:hypothetical protein